MDLSKKIDELLVKSADYNAAVAALQCRGSLVDAENCAWYHGAWQYLRLMNLVSSPTWHNDFYLSSATTLSHKDNPRLLVSGTADYAMCAYALEALRRSGRDGNVTIVDVCATPLIACEWYAHQTNQKVNVRRSDIRDLAKAHSRQYDAIYSDAFLTRFGNSDVNSVLEAWAKLLKKGGHIFTTVRVYDKPQLHNKKELYRGFEQRVQTRWVTYNGRVKPTTKQILKASSLYIHKMSSQSHGTEQNLVDLLNQHFRVIRVERSMTSGGLGPTPYLRAHLQARS